MPVIPLGGQLGQLPRAVSWPGPKGPEEDPPVGETSSIKSVLRRSLTEPDKMNRINKSVSFSEDPEVNEFSPLSDALHADVDSPSADSSDHSPAQRANPYRNMPVEELCLLSQHLNAELSLLSQMDPEALAPADGAAFSPSRIPITPTEMESPQEVRDETDAPTCGEESERVEPTQEYENQRLPELHEYVAGMAETGTDVSWEGGQAKSKVVHTVVALGPGPLNQEAATSSASGYGGHAFPPSLPGKAMPAMAPLGEVSQASYALEEVPRV